MNIYAPNDEIKHYDACGIVNVLSAKTSSYHEFGDVSFMEINGGHVKVETGASVDLMYVNPVKVTIANDGIITKSTTEQPVNAVSISNNGDIDHAQAATQAVATDQNGTTESTGKSSGIVFEFTENYNVEEQKSNVASKAVDEQVKSNQSGSTSYAARILSQGYISIGEAVTAAKDGDTVTLLKNQDITASGLQISKSIVLNLNGYEIKAGEANTTNIYVTNKLTIKDTSTAQSGKIYTDVPYDKNNSCGLIRVVGTEEQTAELSIESGSIEAVMDDPSNKGQYAIVMDSYANVVINGGNITAGFYTISASANKTNTSIIVNNGTLISTSDYAIFNPDKNSNVTINGGVVYGQAGGIAMFQGTLNVKGGIITSKGMGNTGTWGDGTGNLSNAAIYLGKDADGYGNVDAAISGGKITSEGNASVIKISNAKYTITLQITGGEFSTEPTNIASGYHWDATTKSVVVD